MQQTFRFLILVALLTPLTALAKETVILQRATHAPNQIKLSLDPAFGDSWKGVHIARLALQTPGHQRRLDLGPLAKSGGIDVDLSPIGADCALIQAELGPAPKGDGSMPKVTRVSKLLVCPPGDGQKALAARRRAGAMTTTKAGSRFEVRPLNNPATVRPNTVLVVRIYDEGESRADLRVVATGPDGATREALTDRGGIAVLTIPTSGAWTVRYTAVRDDQTYEASLSFEVLPTTTGNSVAWRAIEGGAR